MNLSPLAEFEFVAVLGVMVPIIALLIPIVAIFTTHQRRMAELIHRNHAESMALSEVAGMRDEIRQLKELVHQQAITIDSLGTRQASSLGEKVKE